MKKIQVSQVSMLINLLLIVVIGCLLIERHFLIEDNRMLEKDNCRLKSLVRNLQTENDILKNASSPSLMPTACPTLSPEECERQRIENQEKMEKILKKVASQRIFIGGPITNELKKNLRMLNFKEVDISDADLIMVNDGQEKWEKWNKSDSVFAPLIGIKTKNGVEVALGYCDFNENEMPIGSLWDGMYQIYGHFQKK